MKKLTNDSSNNDEFKKQIRACLGLQKKIHSKILKAKATCQSYEDENIRRLMYEY